MRWVHASTHTHTHTWNRERAREKENWWVFLSTILFYLDERKKVKNFLFRLWNIVQHHSFVALDCRKQMATVTHSNNKKKARLAVLLACNSGWCSVVSWMYKPIPQPSTWSTITMIRSRRFSIDLSQTPITNCQLMQFPIGSTIFRQFISMKNSISMNFSKWSQPH